MSDPGTLAWFARHESRLAWRDWIAMMTAGRRRRMTTVVLVMAAFAALMHLLAFPIVKRFADYGYEGWFVVEAEQDPKRNPPLLMAQVGHKELMRVMTAAGYTVETQGFPN